MMARSSERAWIARVWERSPCFWPLSSCAAAFDRHETWPSVAEIDACLSPRASVRFVAQAPARRRRERSMAARYDASICERGVVPTREGSWHDFFNALVWAAFPRSKRALHERQHRARANADATASRTREQDGLALLDEGGVVLLCAHRAADAVRRALEARDEISVADATRRGDALGVVFGHAVYEHIAAGAPPVRAMVHVAPRADVPTSASACVLLADEALAAALVHAGSFSDPDRFRSVRATPDVLGRAPIDAAEVDGAARRLTLGGS